MTVVNIANSKQNQVKEAPIKRGDYFLIDGKDDLFILASVNTYELCLIDVSSGNRWADPVMVGSINEVTIDEWMAICADASSIYRVRAININYEV